MHGTTMNIINIIVHPVEGDLLCPPVCDVT